MYESLADGEQYLHEEMLFIPKNIADPASRAIGAVRSEKVNFVYFRPFFPTNPNSYNSYLLLREKFLSEFNDAAGELEKLSREYLSGPSLQKSQ